MSRSGSCWMGSRGHPLTAEEFHYYLRRIVEVGFGNGVMFGSDQMVWFETLEAVIETIENATYLREEQKRDIFYNNATRFLDLTEEEIQQHYGGKR